MTKSLSNRLYLKQRFYTFKMKEGNLDKHVDEFSKIILDLQNVGVKIDEEDQGLILLRSLPKSYDNLLTTLLYGRDTIRMEDIKASLISTELRKRVLDDYNDISGSSLSVRGRNQNQYQHNQGRSRSKSRNRKIKCYHCQREGHLRRECPGKPEEKRSHKLL